MAQGSELVIRVTDLKKHYGDVRAVDGVTFEVGKGEVFGMLGPNGAGKTTTIEVLEGLRPPDSGTVEVLGLDVRRHAQSVKQRIGVQLQSVSLYPRLTVTELLDLFGSFFQHHVPTKQLIDAVDLGERAKAWAMNLSGGQQQRLSIALALVNDPELVFLDEPTTGLDPQARRSLWDLIKALQERGTTVMLTTHYMEEATELCNRVAIMDHGHILEMGAVLGADRAAFQGAGRLLRLEPEAPDGADGAPRRRVARRPGGRPDGALLERRPRDDRCAPGRGRRGRAWSPATWGSARRRWKTSSST